jgi:hypothetical protein
MVIGRSGLPALRDVPRQYRARASGLFLVTVSTLKEDEKKKEIRLTDLTEEPSNRPEEWEMVRFESRIEG